MVLHKRQTSPEFASRSQSLQGCTKDQRGKGLKRFCCKKNVSGMVDTVAMILIFARQLYIDTTNFAVFELS